MEPSVHVTPAIPHKNFCHVFFNIISVNAQYKHSRETVFLQNCDFDHIIFTSSLILFNASVIKSYQSGNSHNYSIVNQIASKQLWLTGSRIQKFAIVT
jgi:hypothetical protein